MFLNIGRGEKKSGIEVSNYAAGAEMCVRGCGGGGQRSRSLVATIRLSADRRLFLLSGPEKIPDWVSAALNPGSFLDVVSQDFPPHPPLPSGHLMFRLDAAVFTCSL